MLAIQYTQYGNPEVLKIVDINQPIPKDDEILIKNIATTVNSGDVRLRKADPFLVRLMFGLFRPRNKILGNVIAGKVEAVGKNVTSYKVGDEVFGLNDLSMGAYSEYLVVSDKTPLAHKPLNIDFEEAASTVFGGHTALYFLKKVGIMAGQKILIYGASGAVGSSAIQIAKHFGANVTAVCSGQNRDLVKALGADSVVDYTEHDMSGMDQEFDIVYETVNKTKVSTIAKLAKLNGVLILGAVIIKGMLQGLWISKKLNIKLVVGTAQATSKDMNFLKTLIETNKLKPVTDKTYTFNQIAQAHHYVDQGHKKGNVVIKIQPI